MDILREQRPERDSVTGKYISTNGKTKKMLKMEKELGTTFEDDYRENYLSGKMNKSAFAKRWGTSRTLLFDKKLKEYGRKTWVERVGL